MSTSKINEEKKRHRTERTKQIQNGEMGTRQNTST